jgi:menaquinol-cytochrome c reductase iron-sulfur subunit
MFNTARRRSMAEILGRRKFFHSVIGAFSAVAGLFLGIPFVAALVGSAARAREGDFNEVGSVDDLPLGRPVDLPFAELSQDAFLERETVRRVWVVKRSETRVSVFSPICPHLGCRLDWDQAALRFVCPCHASAYDIDGRVLGGPAPRPLDVLPAEIRKGRVYVRWRQFKVGTADKILA